MNIFETYYKEICEKLDFNPNLPVFDKELSQNIEQEKNTEQTLAKQHNIGAIKIKSEKDQKPFAIEAIKRAVNTYNNFEAGIPFFNKNPKSLEVELYKMDKLWNQFVYKSVYLGVTQPTKIFIIKYLNNHYGFNIPLNKTEAGFAVPALQLAVVCAARKAILDAVDSGKMNEEAAKIVLMKINRRIESNIEKYMKTKDNAVLPETPVDVFKPENEAAASPDKVAPETFTHPRKVPFNPKR